MSRSKNHVRHSKAYDRRRRASVSLRGVEQFERRQLMAADSGLLNAAPSLVASAGIAVQAPATVEPRQVLVQWEGRQVHAVPGEFVFDMDAAKGPKVPAGWSTSSLGSDKWLLVAPGASEGRVKSWATNVGAAKLEPNYLMQPLGTPVDPEYPVQWHLPRIHAPTAWDNTTGSASVIVAVIDSGIDYNHPDFSTAPDPTASPVPALDRKNIWRNPNEIANNGKDDDSNGKIDDIYGWDFGANDADPMDDDPNWEDREDSDIAELGTRGSINKYTGHGTAVAGVMGAVAGSNDPQQMVAGVNWDIDMMALKITRPGYGYVLSAAVQAYDYIKTMRDQNVNIVVANCSWGTYEYNVDIKNLQDQIEEAGGKNVLTVAAAGDDGVNIDRTPFYPASFDSPYVLSVAATNQDDTLWDGSPDFAWRDNSSNYGRTSVDVAAPGKLIQTTIATAIGGGTGNWEGTSMAAGIVTGVAALMKAANTTLPALALKNIIINTVEKVPTLNGLVLSGGLVNAETAVSEALLPSVPQIDIIHLPGQERGVLEGHTGFTTATWQIRVRGPLDRDPQNRTLYVTYRTVDGIQTGGSATADGKWAPGANDMDKKSDYVPVQGTLAFLPGKRMVDYRLSKAGALVDVGRIRSVPVKVFGDRNVEDDETMTLRIDRVYYKDSKGNEQTVNAYILTQENDFTIINDDTSAPDNTDPTARTPQITFVGNTTGNGAGGGTQTSVVEAREGDKGTSVMRFPVKLSLPTTNRVTVRYRTVDAEGRAGVDYVGKTGMLTFAPNVTTQYVDISILGNTVAQENRSFRVELYDPTNAELPGTTGGTAGRTATGRIMDDDALISVAGTTVGAALATATASENGGFMVIPLTLSRAVQKQVTIAFATKDITAIGGRDYVISRGTVTFAPGQTRAELRIPLINDTFAEPDESFLVELSSPTNAGLSTSKVRCTIRDDDGVAAAVAGGISGSFSAAGTTTGTTTRRTASAAAMASLR